MIFFFNKVGRILDTIFNNNHDSMSSSLLSTGGDDYVILDTPSHSRQFATQSSSSTSSSSFSEARDAREASTASPRKDSNSKFEQDSEVTESTVPETCTQIASGSQSDDNNGSTSTTNLDGTVKPVSRSF